MQCILYKIYFWKVFHMYYNLICTPMWTKFYSCKKWVLQVLENFELCRKIMDKAHCSRYSIHPRTNKMYEDLKKNFWWMRMKRENVRYVLECDTCRRVKANHLRPAGSLQPLSIPEWKWKNIYMDFIVGLPRTSHGYNSIWVIVDHLTMSAHFIPVSTTYRVQ
jgi:hypothetical protein